MKRSESVFYEEALRRLEDMIGDTSVRDVLVAIADICKDTAKELRADYPGERKNAALWSATAKQVLACSRKIRA